MGISVPSGEGGEKGSIPLHVCRRENHVGSSWCRLLVRWFEGTAMGDPSPGKKQNVCGGWQPSELHAEVGPASAADHPPKQGHLLFSRLEERLSA